MEKTLVEFLEKKFIQMSENFTHTKIDEKKIEEIIDDTGNDNEGNDGIAQPGKKQKIKTTLKLAGLLSLKKNPNFYSEIQTFSEFHQKFLHIFSWTPETHGLFPVYEREAVLEVMKIWSFSESGITKLPKDILFFILARAFKLSLYTCMKHAKKMFGTPVGQELSGIIEKNSEFWTWKEEFGGWKQFFIFFEIYENVIEK